MKDIEQKIIIAGFGGQGVVKLGNFIADTHLYEDRITTEMPSYGPEMRGGTANCQVIVSEKKIGSPFFNDPSIAIILNKPSLEKFEPTLQPSGLLIYDSSLISNPPERDDIDVLGVPARESADKLGNKVVANVVMLGAYVACTKSCKIVTVLEKTLPTILEKEGKLKLLDINQKAFIRGTQYAFEHKYKDVDWKNLR